MSGRDTSKEGEATDEEEVEEEKKRKAKAAAAEAAMQEKRIKETKMIVLVGGFDDIKEGESVSKERNEVVEFGRGSSSLPEILMGFCDEGRRDKESDDSINLNSSSFCNRVLELTKILLLK